MDTGVVLSPEDYAARHDFVRHVELHSYRSYRGDQSGHVPHAIFKLRYEVYCIECAFLPAAEAAGGMEIDEYETASVHFAAYSADETLIGTARLVQPPAAQPYPLERHCRLFDGARMPPRAQTGEISRLVVRKGYRRRRADSLLGVPGIEPLPAGAAERRHGERRGDSPMLLFGIYREMFRHSQRSGIRYWLAAMERSLAHSLVRLGFDFEAIGPQTDYYGTVAPYQLDLQRTASTMAQANPELAAWFLAPARDADLSRPRY